jgi:uncharacterized protein
VVKKKVILDTNFLLIPGQFKVDIFTEIKRVMDEPFQMFIIDKTMDELKGIEILGKTIDKQAVKLGRMLAESLIKQKSLKTINSYSKKHVDDIIVSKANNNVYVATQDKGLKKRVKAEGAKIITLKQKKYLIKE